MVRFSGCEGPSTYPDGQSGWLAGLRLTWAHRTKQCPTACLGRALVKPLRPTPQSAGLARPGLPFYEKKVEYEVLSCRSLPSHPGSKFLCRSTYTVIGHDWGPNNPLRRGELVEKRDVLERTISVLIAFPIVVTEARTQTRYSQHMMLKLSGRPTETYVSSLHPFVSSLWLLMSSRDAACLGDQSDLIWRYPFPTPRGIRDAAGRSSPCSCSSPVGS